MYPILSIHTNIECFKIKSDYYSNIISIVENSIDFSSGEPTIDERILNNELKNFFQIAYVDYKYAYSVDINSDKRIVNVALDIRVNVFKNLLIEGEYCLKGEK